MNDRMSAIMTVALTQLATALPIILVYLGGILASAFLRRHSNAAAMLLLAGSLLLLISIVAGSFAHAYLLALRMDDQWTPMQFSTASGVLGVMRSILSATGLTLIL